MRLATEHYTIPPAVAAQDTDRAVAHRAVHQVQAANRAVHAAAVSNIAGFFFTLNDTCRTFRSSVFLMVYLHAHN